jgi:hypothetical protein
MTTKLDDFLRQNKIDPRRLLAVSKRIERLRAEDRAIRLRRRLAKGEAAAAAAGEKADKPRSGRPVSAPLLARAQAGKALTGASKTRILRAINRILENRKKDPVDLRALF